MELLNDPEVTLQASVDQHLELFTVLSQHFGSFGKCQFNRTIASVIWYMAAGLVTHQINMDILGIEVFQAAAMEV